MNLLQVTVLISIACLTTDLVSAAKKKKRLSALETAVDQLYDGLDSLMKREEVVATKLKEINSTVQEMKEGNCPRSDIPRSCMDIAHQLPDRKPGYYLIYTTAGEWIEVFCDFYGTRGYMFLSREALSKLDSLDGLYTLHDHAIIRVLHADAGAQHDVKVSQIPLYQDRFALNFQISKADGYKLPINDALKPYIYLGFIPKDVAQLKTKYGRNALQGYKAGVHDVLFHNCDQNPNSYIAFFGNDASVTENGYWKRCCDNERMRAWFIHDEKIPANRYLRPEDFFFYEMHMGGCGGYFTSSHGIKYGVQAATLGLGFDIKPRC